MPSKKVLEEKQGIVTELAQKLKNATAGVIIDYKGISVEIDTKLRREMRDAGVDYSVVKNTLLRFAAKEAGLSGLDSVLEGTTSLAVSSDPIAAAKIAAKYADLTKNCFEIKAGFMDGQVMDKDKTIAVGKLPSKDQLVGQLLSVLTANVRGLAVALNAIAEKEPA